MFWGLCTFDIPEFFIICIRSNVSLPCHSRRAVSVTPLLLDISTPDLSLWNQIRWKLGTIITGIALDLLSAYTRIYNLILILNKVILSFYIKLWSNWAQICFAEYSRFIPDINVFTNIIIIINVWIYSLRLHSAIDLHRSVRDPLLIRRRFVVKPPIWRSEKTCRYSRPPLARQTPTSVTE